MGQGNSMDDQHLDHDVHGQTGDGPSVTGPRTDMDPNAAMHATDHHGGVAPVGAGPGGVAGVGSSGASMAVEPTHRKSRSMSQPAQMSSMVGPGPDGGGGVSMAPVPVPHGGEENGMVRREDSQDFAMSIADGLPQAHMQQQQQQQQIQQQQQYQQAQHQQQQQQQQHSHPPHQAASQDPQHQHPLPLPSSSAAPSPTPSTGSAAGSVDRNNQIPAYGQSDTSLMMTPSPLPPKFETVPTAFKWVHGGTEVYVTGSFNNWQGKILMYPNEDGEEFTLLIDIPPGTHHYKYIVDQEWRLDEDAPTVQIDNVWNNVVEVKRPVFEYTPANFADSDDEDEGKGKAPYGQRAPLSNDYINDPPKMPPHLTDVLLNQVQPHDPLMLPLPTHVSLNHLYVMQGTAPDVLVTGLTQRFKPNQHARITHKFVTTVYYSPLNRYTMGTNSSSSSGGAPSPLAGPAGMQLPNFPHQQTTTQHQQQPIQTHERADADDI